MRTILQARWLLLVNTLPLAILFGMYVGIYQIIGTLLAEENTKAWLDMAIILALLWVLNWGYAVFLLLKKQEIQLWYAIFVLFAYTIFFLQYAENERLLIPPNVPRWMLPNSMWEYVGTFLMPLLFHALMVVIVRLTPSFSFTSAWKNLAFALLVPFAWYFFIVLAVPLINRSFEYHKIIDHALVLFSVSVAVFFLFSLCKAIYIFVMLQLQNSKQASQDTEIQKKKFNLVHFLESNDFLVKIAVGVIAPLSGLALNQALDNFFGNFEHYFFYLIAALNGVFLCLPPLPKPTYRLILFAFRSFTFTYIFYFFLVFLPVLPIAMALLLTVIGSLTLVPLILTFIQIQQLWADMQYLYAHFNRVVVNVLLVVALLMLPVAVHFLYLSDKKALHEALDYVYASSLEGESKKINAMRLESVLEEVQRNKEKINWGWRNRQSPYLSLYYNWLVLDNLTLSTEKIEKLSNIFVGESKDYGYYDWRRWGNNSFPDSVKISKVNVNSTFNKEKQFWTSWIDLEITNLDTATTPFSRQSEYRTLLNLPEGCWISDYYLWIGEEKVHGLLAEKKTAMWVYNEILSERRDPGLLHYTSGNQVSLRVFPFVPSEVRKTGLQLIHKEPIHFQIDSLNLFLGDTLTQPKFDKPLASVSKQAIYLPKAFKKQLPKVKRATYPHFIVNCSKEKEKKQAEYQKRINQFLANHSLSKDKAKISFTNTYIKTVDLSENWQNDKEKWSFEGGFYLERAIEKILFENRNQAQIPQIIVVSDSLSEAVLGKNFKEYQVFYPENQVFFLLDAQDEVTAYSLSNLEKINESYTPQPTIEVLAWKNEEGQTFYLPDSEQASVVWNEKATPGSEEVALAQKDWESGLYLQGQWFAHTFHPERTDQEWLPLVKNSFKAQVMTPVTSFISLENEAQRQALLQKQEEVLQAKKSLDISEDEVRMSEWSYSSAMLIGIYLLFLLLAISVKLKN
ncbi:MSEP-CTERM sorting domain-containing protein [Thermoflexibacter ruber]|uniref:MSEP-CTERM protein n=1 Tax=Thermoflexibacter ruber TaxID=1003 RepID=A0A1I2HAB5_9BACT|nr:MSEP-CTERM sorting domain-containing protein [Thermoflexibacter ruber]SFF26240.1 MSEP-CTERM protein [Thermoflexibacter ruber]